MTSLIDKTLTFGVVVGSRAFFNPAVAVAAREQVLAQLDKLGSTALILPAEATENGAVQSREDARLYADFFRQHRDEIDGLVILLPNFGDEIAVAELRQHAPSLTCRSCCRLATTRSTRSTSTAAAMPSAARSRSPTTSTNTASRSPTRACHTCDVDGDEFRGDLDRFARVCRTVRGLRNARIGAIGARTGAVPDHALLARSCCRPPGITVVTVDLSEIIGAAEAHRATTTPDVKREAGRDLRLRHDPGAHRAREHRQAGEVGPRRRPLDRGERMRRELHPVLASACRTISAAPPASPCR